MKPREKPVGPPLRLQQREYDYYRMLAAYVSLVSVRKSKTSLRHHHIVTFQAPTFFYSNNRHNFRCRRSSCAATVLSTKALLLELWAPVNSIFIALDVYHKDSHFRVF